jgi:hypothetical protein
MFRSLSMHNASSKVYHLLISKWKKSNYHLVKKLAKEFKSTK